ncbi:uncharacterized protein J3D65DRAFT_603087 [Phyllosticta citribraziliensis]|uniref:Uncharacterized protein n=1 Tax=Phyllosticta citribraziliensis TaxID=989973 RepID=A0ABR1LQM7_9PEZI
MWRFKWQCKCVQGGFRRYCIIFCGARYIRDEDALERVEEALDRVAERDRVALYDCDRDRGRGYSRDILDLRPYRKSSRNDVEIKGKEVKPDFGTGKPTNKFYDLFVGERRRRVDGTQSEESSSDPAQQSPCAGVPATCTRPLSIIRYNLFRRQRLDPPTTSTPHPVRRLHLASSTFNLSKASSGPTRRLSKSPEHLTSVRGFTTVKTSILNTLGTMNTNINPESGSVLVGGNMEGYQKLEDIEIFEALAADDDEKALNLAKRALLDPHLPLYYRFKYELLAASLEGGDPWPHAEEAEKALKYLEEDVEDNPHENEVYQKESNEAVRRLHKDLEILKEDLREYERKEAAAELAQEQVNQGLFVTFLVQSSPLQTKLDLTELDQGGLSVPAHWRVNRAGTPASMSAASIDSEAECQKSEGARDMHGDLPMAQSDMPRSPLKCKSTPLSQVEEAVESGEAGEAEPEDEHDGQFDKSRHRSSTATHSATKKGSKLPAPVPVRLRPGCTGHYQKSLHLRSSSVRSAKHHTHPTKGSSVKKQKDDVDCCETRTHEGKPN